MTGRRTLALLAVVGLILAIAAWSVIAALPRAQVAVMQGNAADALAWPRIAVERQDSRTTAIALTDVDPKAHVAMTLEGRPVALLDWRQNSGAVHTWTWRWQFDTPSAAGYAVHFYHSCDEGCLVWAQVHMGQVNGNTEVQPHRVPTKLGVVFPYPDRDWHNRAGWAVELIYVAQPHAGYTPDDLAERVFRNTRAGLRTLVRVDYDKGQTLPAQGDYLALETYLQSLKRLARDARLRDAFAFIIGSGFNERGSNSKAPANRLITPEWYARVLNGYGESPQNDHNAVEMMRAANPSVRVLVGPVRPFSIDQTGELTHSIDAPWLNYMNTLVAYLDESARQKAGNGIALTAPDGFAINAPGRIDAPELRGANPADEPKTDLKRAAWNGAQAGFRVYRDWLDIINAYPSTRGLPVYINATNTMGEGEMSQPAQNYPRGWLSMALDEVNQQPQIHALCWFMDGLPGDANWDAYSLSNRKGKLGDADDEFTLLLRR